MVTAPRTVLCAPRSRCPRKVAPPSSGRRARAPSQARQRREQRQARGGGPEAQLEDTVVVARGGGEREPASERALVGDQQRGARALERVRAPIRVAPGEADAMVRRPEKDGARGGER